MIYQVPATFLFLIALMVPNAALAQSARRAGAAGAMSDLANKYIDQEIEIETARKKAEIEIEKYRQMQQMQRAPRATDTSAVRDEHLEMQERILGARHPQWDRIIASTAFHRWLSSQPAAYAGMCNGTREALVVSRCIDDFLGPPVPASNAK